MFKKTKISAVAAAVMGMSSMGAQAVALNSPGSQGQVLIFPYYNVNDSFITGFNITNTTDDTKAVKIRYRTSKFSNDVLDFNLYMSPRDVYTMSLRRNPDDSVVMTTKDTSCTFPAMPEGGFKFLNVYKSDAESDLHEGYLEVIEMGVIPEYFNREGRRPRRNYIAEGIAHVVNDEGVRVPLDCGVIQAAWEIGDFTSGGARSNGGTGVPGDIDYVAPDNVFEDPSSDEGYYGDNFPHGLTAPTGGLVGSSILVDVAKGSGFVTEPVSIVDYSNRPQHYLASDLNLYLLPSLASGSVDHAHHLTHDNIPPVYAVKNEYPRVRRDWGLDDQNTARSDTTKIGVPSGINPMPIADALLVETLGNQYFLGPNTSTDWVVAAPMRKHAIYNGYQYYAKNDGVGKPIYQPGALIDYPDGTQVCVGDIPVDGKCGDPFVPDDAAFWGGRQHVGDITVKFEYWDREEAKGPYNEIISPPVREKMTLVREVNVISFSPFGAGENPESVLGSQNAQNVQLAKDFIDGWALMSNTDHSNNLYGFRYEGWLHEFESKSNGHAIGLPLHGFMAARSSVRGNSVGETFNHFTTRFEDRCYGKEIICEVPLVEAP